MEHRTLVLTPWMSPHRIISWEDAICDLIVGKLDVLTSYEEVVRSPSVEFQIPCVARLVRHLAGYKKGVKFSRFNVMTRDHFKCCYCGRQLPMRQLNYDHVIPRMQGGKTVWENIVTSCYPCNDKKAGRTPAQAGMHLLRKPHKPKTLPLTTPALSLQHVPDAWKSYLQPEALAVG